MQGKKKYQEKLFTDFRLSDRIPRENFYCRLKEALDLDFLYPLTKGFYGQSGQKSIDPVVFFKLCLVGYLENIISDREGKLSVGKHSHREVLTPLHSNKAILCRVSFFGFLARPRREAFRRKAFPARYFIKPLTY